MTQAPPQPQPKTAAQNRKIWALKGQLGLTEDMLRDMVEAATGQRTISGLSYRQAWAVIRDLESVVGVRRRNHRRVGPPSARVSAGQIKYMHDLVAQGALHDIWAFRSWLKRYHKVGHEKWLNSHQAWRVIEGLKDMLRRKKEKEQAAQEEAVG